MSVIIAYCSACSRPHIRYMCIVSNDLVQIVVNRLAAREDISAIVITEI